MRVQWKSPAKAGFFCSTATSTSTAWRLRCHVDARRAAHAGARREPIPGGSWAASMPPNGPGMGCPARISGWVATRPTPSNTCFRVLRRGGRPPFCPPSAICAEGTGRPMPGPLAAWMPPSSPHGRVYGVSWHGLPGALPPYAVGAVPLTSRAFAAPKRKRDNRSPCCRVWRAVVAGQKVTLIPATGPLNSCFRPMVPSLPFLSASSLNQS